MALLLEVSGESWRGNPKTREREAWTYYAVAIYSPEEQNAKLFLGSECALARKRDLMK